LSGDSDKGMSKWLKSIGEAPVEYNRFNVDKSKKQIRMYLAKKGYFNAEILDTVIIKRRRAKVVYKIYPGVPYRLNNIKFNISDTLLTNIIVPDTTNLPVKRGDVFDEDKLQETITGMEDRMRNEGYYFFKQDYVTMLADSAVGGRRINLDVRVSDPKIKLKDDRILDLSHRKYIINNIRVYMLSLNHI
jgi:outer membrane protein assembly factor BamA